jgi:hypothetical protein
MRARWLLGSMMIIVSVHSAEGQTCVSSRTSEAYVPDTRQIIAGTAVSSSIVNAAIAKWNNSSCNPDGTSFTRFQTTPASGQLPLTAKLVDGFCSTRQNICASFRVRQSFSIHASETETTMFTLALRTQMDYPRH